MMDFVSQSMSMDSIQLSQYPLTRWLPWPVSPTPPALTVVTSFLWSPFPLHTYPMLNINPRLPTYKKAS